ncbi:MAG: HD domain-containing protein [Nitrososphaerales archaeon]
MKRRRPSRTRGKYSGRLDGKALIIASGRLKRIKRSGWIKKAGVTEAESVADHSYRMAVLGMFLAEELRLNSAKIVRMCLLHDLAESVIGDKMPEEKKSEKSHRMEELRVLNLLLSSLPARSRKKLSADAQELMLGNTKEAELTWEVDKLEMSLQRQDYLNAGYDRKKLSQFDCRKKLSRPVQKILDLYKA